MVKLMRSDLEPDVCFFRREKAEKFNPEQVLFPAPDFVVEVLSPKTARLDRQDKFEEYELNGVAEYWIIDPIKQAVEQYRLQEGQYFLAGTFTYGMIECMPLEYFTFPVRAIFDPKINQQTLRELLKST
ncbi:MAG: Uma2 family endonuclease [Bacteroidia bacterium]|nr:Uma2 family endonuclease [Bacteroidia bacterium]